MAQAMTTAGRGRSSMDVFAGDLLTLTRPTFQATCEQTVNLGFGHVFYGFARAMRPRRVVVIGSKAGFAPICFALGLKDNRGFGVRDVGDHHVELTHPGGLPQLHFIDPSYAVERENPGWHSFGEGHWDDDEQVRALWRRFTVEDIVTHFRMTSAEYLQSQPAEEIDLLYVDGDHRYEGVLHDFVRFRPRMAERGIVLAHDVDERIPAAEGEGHRALLDLPPDLYDSVRLRVYPGLAILQPRPSQPV